MVGRDHHDSVNVIALDNPLVFVVGVAAFVGADALLGSVSLLRLGFGALPLAPVHVAHREHLHVVAPEHDGVVRAHHQAHADQSHRDAVAGGVRAEYG